MSKMRIHNPLTGEYIERPIPMRWSRTGRLTMAAGAAAVVFFAYFGNEFYDNGWHVMSCLFFAFAGCTAILMRKLYKAVRLYSNIYAQQLVMAEEHEAAIAELAEARAKSEGQQ